MPDTKIEVPPVQSQKQISFFMWLARITGFLYGLLTLFSISDLFNAIAVKIFAFAGAVCVYTAVWAMGQVPSSKQRAYRKAKTDQLTK
jgi:hypothetical protein